MTTVMLFYKNIVPISRDEHKNLKFLPPENAEFSANTHWVPLAGAEFYQAALTYPVLFMGTQMPDGKTSYTSIALLGLSNDHNDFLNDDKTWQAETYVPAFVRRYPFVLAGSPEKEELTVCYDSQSGMFNDVKGIELFNSDGSVSPFLEENIAFLNGFKNSMEQTAQFTEMLVKLDLLIKKSVDVRSSKGQVARLQDFYIVDEEKFNKLSGDQLHKLHKRGYLGWIFAQLMSMNNLPRLLDLHTSRQKTDNKKEKAKTK